MTKTTQWISIVTSALIITGCGGEDPAMPGTDAELGAFVKYDTDFDNFVEQVAACDSTNDGGVCRNGHGSYQFVQAATVVNPSSSSTSSTSSSSSSSTALTSDASTSQSQSSVSSALSSTASSAAVWAHAPSEDWVMAAGWELVPGSFETAQGDSLISELPGPGESEAFFSIRQHVTAFPRGTRFRIHAEVRSELGSSQLTMRLSDSVLIHDGPDSAVARDVAYMLDEALVEEEWVELSGEFEFWSSSALTLFIGSESAPFYYRNLSIESIGDGVLTGNPVLDPSSQPSGPAKINYNEILKTEAWYQQHGWDLISCDEVPGPGSEYTPPQLSGGTLYPDEPLAGEHGPLSDALIYAVYQDRGSWYTPTVAVKPAGADPVEVQFYLLDGVSVATGDPNQYDIACMKYLLDSATVSGDQWQELSGTFEFWGSSGFRIGLSASGGELLFKELEIRSVPE